MFDVAALYVDASGPYPGLTDHWYDACRDAASYQGELPVVAHPPCGPWGVLAWATKHQPREAGPHAVAEVRRCGGVLEHPVGSQLFKHCGIPTAPWSSWREVDDWGGYTLRLPRWHFGHRGRKDTILYICGTADLPPLPRRDGGTPREVQRMCGRERRLTPPAFAWWLCLVAARCRAPRYRPVQQSLFPTTNAPQQGASF